MIRKPIRSSDYLDVEYSDDHWRLLKKLRGEAVGLMEIFERTRIDTGLHGSVVRGDVTEESDIDLFLPNPPSSFKIEIAFDNANIEVARRFIVQATPHHVLKGYFEIDDNRVVSFPLGKMTQKEREFYRFGGEIDLEGLKRQIRNSGVDKRLMLIVPTEEGHVESSVVGREEEVAKLLGISPETVNDRVRALLRRADVGRTGVFIEITLSSEETFEMAVKRLAETKPEVRRRLNLFR
jgi:predicted nucleotidyltransferase